MLNRGYALIKQIRLTTSRYGIIQWNLSIKDTLNKGQLSILDTICSLDYIELCTNLRTYPELGNLSIQGSQLGPDGNLYREVPCTVQSTQYAVRMYVGIVCVFTYASNQQGRCQG